MLIDFAMKKILYLVFGLFVIGLLVGVAPHPVRAETVSGTFTTEPALFGGGVYAGNFTFSLTPSPQAGQSSTFQIDFTTPTIFGYHAVVVNDVSQCFPDSEHIDYRQQHDTDRQGGPQYALRPGIVTLVLLNSPGQETQSGRWRASFSKVFPGNAVGRICEYQLVNWSGTFGAQHGGWWPITPSLFTPPPTLNFSISPTSVTSGQNFTLIWTSAYATTITTSRSPVSCPDAGGFFPVAGGSTPLTAQTVATSTICTYTATANGPGGTSPPVSRQVTVNPLPVLAPTVKLEAKGPTSDFNDTAVTVKTGETFILRWSSTNAGSLRAFVSANPASVGCPDAGTPLLPFWPFTLWRFFDPPAGGTQVLSAPASPVECTYYATASGNGTAVTDQVLVRVIAPLPPLVVICSAGPNPANISQEVTWTAVVTGGGTEPPSFAWTGDDGLAGTTNPLPGAFYASAGLKHGTVKVTKGNETKEASCTVTVNPAVLAPTLTGIVPNSGIVGTVVPVTLTGTNFAAGATINAGAGITVANIVVVSPTQITATFTIASNATLGDRNVTVTVGGLTSNPKIFTVNPSGGDGGGGGGGGGGGAGGGFSTSCGLLICFTYDSRITTAPPPGFIKPQQNTNSEIAP